MALNTDNYNCDLSLKLGRGSFASVYVGVSKQNESEKVAVKVIENDEEDGGIFSESAKKEFHALRKVCDKGHVNIIKLLEYHSEGRFLFFVMELCELGDLEKYVKRTPLNLRDRINIMTQCADGVCFLHSLHVVHRDLKPQNILIKEDPSGGIVIKISDFGLSKVQEKKEKGQFMSTNAGTPWFRAPELLKKGRLQYTSAVDVFALGLVYAVLLKYDAKEHNTFEPYVNEHEPFILYGAKLLSCQNKNEKPPSLFTIPAKNDLEQEMYDLVGNMVQTDHEKRLEMKVVSHELKHMFDYVDSGTEDSRASYKNRMCLQQEGK